MVLYVKGSNIIQRATVTKNIPQGQANLDYSEQTITNQHSPINNGQGLPSAYADMPTNANGTQADLNYDHNTITNSTWTNKVADHHGFGNQTRPNSDLDLAFLGANNTSPKNDLDMILMGADYKVEIDKGNQQADYHYTSDGLQVDNRNLAQENTPPSVNTNPPNPSMIGGNRLSQDEYQAMLDQQRQNKTKNFEPTPLSFPKAEKLELNAKDFFKGTKSGNEVFNPVDVFKNDGTKDIKNVKGYADVDPFGDFSGTNPFSNEKANSKALKKQFDFYKSISNF